MFNMNCETERMRSKGVVNVYGSWKIESEISHFLISKFDNFKQYAAVLKRFKLLMPDIHILKKNKVLKFKNFSLEEF